MAGVETCTKGVNTMIFVLTVFGTGVNTTGVNTLVQLLIHYKLTYVIFLVLQCCSVTLVAIACFTCLLLCCVTLFSSLFTCGTMRPPMLSTVLCASCVVYSRSLLFQCTFIVIFECFV